LIVVFALLKHISRPLWPRLTAAKQELIEEPAVKDIAQNQTEYTKKDPRNGGLYI